MGKPTTQTTENKPPKWAQPLFEQSAKEAQKLYNKEKGFEPYAGDRVADLTSAQKSGINQLINLDAWNSLLDQSQSLFKQQGNLAIDPRNPALDAAGSDFYRYANQTLDPRNKAIDDAISVFRSGATGSGVNVERLQELYKLAQGTSAAEQNLQGIAAGDSLMGDKLFQEMLDAQSAKIADQVNAGFSSAGRYGSAAHAGTVGDSVGEFRRDAVLQNYAAERDRQLAAINAIDAARNARFGNMSSAANSLAAVQAGNIDRRLGAAGALGGLGQQIIGNQQAEAARQMAASQALANFGQQIFSNQQTEAGRTMSVADALAQLGQMKFGNQQTAAQADLFAGGMQQQQSQAEMDAKRALWTERENLDWTRLGALQAAAAGAAGPYGTATTMSQQPFNPLGILGMLGSLFMSDRRLKTNIKRVGERDGFPLYEFDYVWGGPRMRGVMADDVEKVRPDAVVTGSDGYKAVNYAALGFDMELA